MLSTALELAGLTALVIAAALVSPVLGVFAVGVALLVVGVFAEGR